MRERDRETERERERERERELEEVRKLELDWEVGRERKKGRDREETEKNHCYPHIRKESRTKLITYIEYPRQWKILDFSKMFLSFNFYNVISLKQTLREIEYVGYLEVRTNNQFYISY